MILKDIAGNNLDLSKSHNFVTHYNSNASCANIIMRQLNDKNIFEFLRGYKDLTILDIGANIGLFSLFCRPIAKNIYSIEPTPSHFNVKSILIRMSHHIRMSHPYNTAVEHINYCPFCDGSKRIGEIKALKTGYYLLICNRKHESICVEKNEYTSLETIRAEINKFNCVKWDKW